MVWGALPVQFQWLPSETTTCALQPHLRNASSKSQGRLVAANTMTSMGYSWDRSFFVHLGQKSLAKRIVDPQIDWFWDIHQPKVRSCFSAGNLTLVAYVVSVLQELIQSKIWTIHHWCILSFPHRVSHLWAKRMSNGWWREETNRLWTCQAPGFLTPHKLLFVVHMKVGPVEPSFYRFRIQFIANWVSISPQPT